MKKFKRVMTEQVSKWHPDKIADQISDAFTMLATTLDSKERVAIETLIKKRESIFRTTDEGSIDITIAGETSVKEPELLAHIAVSKAFNDLQIKETPRINLVVTKQSSEIAQAVGDNVGAGDQGMMFGMAVNSPETDYLPKGHFVANEVIRTIEDYVDTNGRDELLDGDAKVNVIHNLETDIIEEITVSVCHNENITDLDVLKEKVSKIVFGNEKLLNITSGETVFRVNPGGLWTIGGALADTGLTGRKIVADAYGGYYQVGGGAFSGKDLTKVDRSAAYMARKVAKEIALEEDYKEVYIQVGYSIGQELPSILEISYRHKWQTTRTNNFNEEIKDEIRERFRVSNMVKELEKTNLYELSKGCHFR